MRNDWVSNVARLVAIVAALVCVLSPAAALLAVVDGLLAFRAMLAGLGLGAVGAILGLIGLWRCRAGIRAGRARAGGAVAVGGVLVLAVLVKVFPALGLPVINDITTDLEHPPAFSARGPAARSAGGLGEYPRGAFASAQRSAYPDIQPLRAQGTASEARRAIHATVADLGWTLLDPGAQPDDRESHYELVITSPVFRFKDDAVVRVKAIENELVVDMRSRSRVGRGDLGANAQHIREFFARFKQNLE